MKTAYAIIMLVAVFACSYLVAFMAISYVQSTHRTYSMPSSFGVGVAAVCSVGPAPNSTDVPLDTAIVFDEFRPISVSNVKLQPQVTLLETFEDYGVASRRAIFYPTGNLKPATTYTVYANIAGQDKIWAFTTTNSLNLTTPTKTDASYISLIAAIAITTVAGIIRLKSKHINQ